ncbi:MAG: 3-phosphoshikimate 1-carboxyvinyltransferase [Candidatus Eisenbacteria bacterium]|uniref:3-phosphoshikimate 1-carboxyvinyltransferase n=1 Tax=Eiseniibacteriota bacterium TaxID=2212470 RepID=A0A933WAH7_UNCEI|nr:3-phosphoshikimate 1-carboxyvinyltransferase [Candidatus Eisenbacteria bacterium]
MTPASPAVRRGRPLGGRFTPPGDKSITHRAVLFGLLAEGTSRIEYANPGEDCLGSLRCAEALGAAVRRDGALWELTGTAGALRAPAHPLDCGNSGTTMRLLAGIAARSAAAVTLAGDASLSRRPMARIVTPLERMGARIATSEGGRPPLTITGGALAGIRYDVPVASAQVATCVLLAGLAASGATEVRLPGPARDHTERMLPAYGAALEVTESEHGGRTVRLAGATTLRAREVRVPGDASAAAFFLAAAAAEPGASVTAVHMNLNPTRTGLLDVLAAMGAEVSIEHVRDEAGEPVGDVTVTGPDRLRAFDVPAEWAPRLIDEVPAWVIAASAARGTSSVSGASELRVKESDRVVALARNLAACGIESDERPDGLAVTGGTARGARIEAHLDHRIVMAFAALGARTAEPMTFDDVSSVATSYPGFFSTLGALGAQVEGVA